MTAPDFPAGFLEEIDRAVLDRAGVRLGSEMQFRCPVEGHPDKHPSARWNRDKAIWCRLVCKAGGGAFDLAARLGIAKPERGPGREGDAYPPKNTRNTATVNGCTIAGYAQAKGLPESFLRELGLSELRYQSAPAVRIPYRHPDGTDAATQYRIRLSRAIEGDGRFRWKAGSKSLLYGLDRLDHAREQGEITIVEGASDCHTLWYGGFPAVGLPGAWNWNDTRDAAHLDGIDRIYVVIEPDSGGVAVKRWLDTSSIRERAHLVDLGAFKDPSGLYLDDPDRFPDRWRAATEAAIPWTAEPTPEAPQPLDDVHNFLGRFVAYPSPHARIAHTLWIAHAHLMDAWESTPRLAFLSPEPASGKTRALEITELLVPNPVEAVNVTPAYLFRKVGHEDGAPTVLFDEIDTVFGPKAREHEETRGLLNAGHRRGAVAGRCVVRGKTVETVEYPAYCAVAMAGLGSLPDTILSRSVIVRMRRRAANERVEPYRRRVEAPAGHALRERLAAWADTVRDRVADAWPAMPAGIEDRDSDIWEALFAVADAAGGDWPARARKAAVALVADSKESTPSLGIRLLSDLRQVFGDRDAMSTDDILSSLQGLEEAPWGELVAGKPLNARGLARRLAEYGVKSKTVRIGGTTHKGYSREDLGDAWSRYLSPLGPPPHECDTSVTSVTEVASASTESVTPDHENDTSVTDDDAKTPDSMGNVSDVTDVTDSWEDSPAASNIRQLRQCIQCGLSVSTLGALYCDLHGGQPDLDPTGTDDDWEAF